MSRFDRRDRSEYQMDGWSDDGADDEDRPGRMKGAKRGWWEKGRCKGMTKAGSRCGISMLDEMNPRTRTIKECGYCTHHLEDAEHYPHGVLWVNGTEKRLVLGEDGHPEPEEHPHIVRLARAGNVSEVLHILEFVTATANCKLLNAARERLILKKRGEDGPFDTFMDDTPLIAATRGGHVDVVYELLLRGANAKRGSCPAPGVHETALQIAEGKLLTLLRTTRSAAASSSSSGAASSCATTANQNARSKTVDKKTDAFIAIKDLLKVALQFHPIRRAPSPPAAPKKPAPPPIPAEALDEPGLDGAESERRRGLRQRMKDAFVLELQRWKAAKKAHAAEQHQYNRQYPWVSELDAARGKTGASDSCSGSGVVLGGSSSLCALSGGGVVTGGSGGAGSMLSVGGMKRSGSTAGMMTSGSSSLGGPALKRGHK